MPDLGDYLDELGGSSDVEDRVEFLRLVVPLYVDEGYSGKQGIADLRSQGFSVNSDLYYLFQRQYQDVQNEFEAIRYFPSGYFPSDLDLGVSDFPMSQEYKFVYRVKHLDTNTGEYYYTTFAVETSSFGNISDINQMGIDYIDEFYPGFSDESYGIEVWKGMRRA